jgi:hypothetical protein
MKIIKVSYLLEKDYRDMIQNNNQPSGFRKSFVIRNELLPEKLRELNDVDIYPMFSNKKMEKDKDGMTETITEQSPIVELKKTIEEKRQENIYILNCIISDYKLTFTNDFEQKPEDKVITVDDVKK